MLDTIFASSLSNQHHAVMQASTSQIRNQIMSALLPGSNWKGHALWNPATSGSLLPLCLMVVLGRKIVPILRDCSPTGKVPLGYKSA